MNNTRVGKIARLPKTVREVLGDRLEAGEKASVLANWLNGLECVQDVLQEYFGSRLITEQNLSEWRQGGHQDWLRGERALLLAGRLAEEARDLDWAAGRQPLGDSVARRLAVEMARLAEILVEQETDPRQRWEQLCAVNRELSRLRREDHRAAQMELNRLRLEFQVARAKGQDYELPHPGAGDLRDLPSVSEFELNCLESLAQERHARALPEFKRPFVPVVETEEKKENSKIQTSASAKGAMADTPNSKEDSSAKPQDDKVARQTGLAESDGIQAYPSKSDSSNDPEAMAEGQPPVARVSVGSSHEKNRKNGQNGENRQFQATATPGQIQVNSTETSPIHDILY